MTLEELLTLYAGFVPHSIAAVKMGMEWTLRDLNRKRIGFFVDVAENFGHQSSTIHLLYHLIDLMSERSLAFSEVVVVARYKTEANRERDLEKTAGKLRMLLPGLTLDKNFNPAYVYSLYGRPGVRIRFSAKCDGNEVSVDLHLDIAVTAGLDFAPALEAVENLADIFRVPYFLRLQPYLWREPNKIYIRGREEAICIDHLVKERIYGFKPLAALDEAGWEFYIQSADSQGALKLKMARILFDYLTSSAREEFLLWPVYGLRQLKENYYENLLNLILIARRIQDTPEPELGIKKIVFVLFDNFEPLHLEKVQKALNSQEDMVGLMEEAISLAELEYITCSEDYKTRRTNEILALQAKMREEIRYIWETVSLENLDDWFMLPKTEEDLVEFFSYGPEDGILLFNAGTMPAPVFEQCFAQADIPAIFEGQGTASIAITVGKPYLQLPVNTVGYVDGVRAYPYSESWSEDTKRDIIGIISLISWKLFHDEKKVPEYNFTNCLKEVADNIRRMIKSAGTDRRLRREFLASLARAVADDEKTALALSILYDLKLFAIRAARLAGVRPVFSPAAPEPAEPVTLDALYERLKAAAAKGAVSFHNDFSDMKFSGYLDTVCGEEFLMEADPENITAEGSPAETVLLSKARGVLPGGINTEITAKFTHEDTFGEEDPYIKAEFRASLSEENQMLLGNIPWITFLNPALLLETKESSQPARGGILIADEKEQMELMLCVPPVGDKYQILGTSKKPITAFDFYNAAAGGVSILDALPAPLQAVGGFGLTGMELLYNSREMTLERIGFTLATEKGWVFLEDPKLQVSPRVTVNVSNPADSQKRSTAIEIDGEMIIGSGVLNVAGRYPDFRLQAGLKSGTQIKISELLELFGASIEIDSAVERFEMLYLPDASEFQIAASVGVNWVIGGFFEIGDLGFSVNKKKADLQVSLNGTFSLCLSEADKLDFSVSARYQKGSGWIVWGEQSSDTDTSLLCLLTYFLHCQEAKWNLPVTKMSFLVNTADGSWHFSCGTKSPWRIEFLDMDLSAKIEVGNGKASHPVRTVEGDCALMASEGNYVRLSSDFVWHGIGLSLWFDYHSRSTGGEELFGLSFGALTAVVEKKQGQWKAEIKFSDDTSLGSIIEMMIKWCTGEAHALESPWDLLNKIKFPKNTALVYNFTTGDVSLQLRLENPLELGFARIDGVSLSYEYQKEGGTEKKRAMISLDGSFVWNVGDEAVGDTGRLGPWDASKPGGAPVPDGKGNKYFDLELLALGQNVRIDGMDKAKTIPEAIQLFKDLPVPQGDELPAITYREGDHWLFGAQFGILRLEEGGGYLLDMQMVYNDPDMYGLRLTLKGKAAKVFAGFSAEILYRKVNDSIGVYQGELTLPDKMRHLELGAFSVTLPVFYLEIYTNGDFKVDVGFPKNGDFSRSLSLYAVVPPGLPLTGSAGFYFGRLSAQTACMVPVTSNGLFQPVWVFGLGIKAGLGKSLDAGVLKAGFELTVMTILEGVLAKWNPYPGQGDWEAYYFYLSGTAGIDGRVYGSIDFAIIKAEIDIAIRLTVQFIYETCRKLQFAVALSVSVKAGITLNLGIFKIHLHFSFSMKIKEEFSIGSDKKAPWDGNTLTDSARRPGAIPDFSEADTRKSVSAITGFAWNQLKELSEEECFTVKVWLSGALSAVKGENTAWKPVYVLMALLPSMGEASGGPSGESLRKAAYAQEDSDFEKLAKMLIRFLGASMQKLEPGKEVLTWQEAQECEITLEMLQFLKENIDGLGHDAIGQFLNGQFRIVFSTGLAQDIHAVPFPVPDSLAVSDGSVHYCFGSFNQVSPQKLTELRKYFDQLAIVTEAENARDTRYLAVENENISMSHWMFDDYFRLLAKQLGKAMENVLEDAGTDRMILKEMIRLLQAEGAFENLAGIVSHYLFHGLRIPWGGDGAMAGIYELTGQQLVLPDNMDKNPYEITFTKEERGKAENWYKLQEDRRCLKLPGEDITYIGQIRKLPPVRINMSELTPEKAVEILPSVWNFGRPAGVMGDSLFTLPKELEALLSEEDKVMPHFEYELVRGKGNDGLELTGANDRIRAGLLSPVRVKRLALAGAYEITCADAGLPRLLKSLYRQIEAAGTAVELNVLYRSAEGYCYDAGGGFTAGIAKANLSTITHPVTETLGASRNIIIGGIQEFVLYLWEAFVTNSGGFYLCYDHPARAGEGLPEDIFDEKGEAVIDLLFLAEEEGLSSWNNVLLMEGCMGDDEMLTAKSVPYTAEVIFTEADSIKDVCGRYHSCVREFARLNAQIPLCRGVILTVGSGCYQYLPEAPKGTSPGNRISSIADWFMTSETAIREANQPHALSDTLKDYETIRLPRLTVKAGERFGGSAGELAAAFGCTAEALLFENEETLPVYEGSIALRVGPFTYHPMVFEGALTFEGDRQNATEVLENRLQSRTAPEFSDCAQAEQQEEAVEFLRNNYTMLGYRIMPGADFEGTGFGLPAAPSQEEDAWKYHLSVPYGRFNARMGSILQMEYEWFDIYGNTGSIEAPAGSRKPIRTGYMDCMIPMSAWPGLSAGWGLKDGKLFIRLGFDALAYTQEGGRDTAGADLLAYRAVSGQLSDINGIRAAVVTTLLEGENSALDLSGEQFNALTGWLWGEKNSICGYLEQIREGKAAVSPGEIEVDFKLPFEALNRQDAFALTCSVVLERKKKAAGAGMEGTRGLFITEWQIGPLQGSSSLFAKEFEMNFRDCGGFFLKLALKEKDEWWCVRIAKESGNGLMLQADAKEPAVYAPRPVCNHLFSLPEAVKLKKYETGKGILPEETEEAVLAEADLDIWMEDLLSAVEGLFDERWIIRIRLLDEIQGIGRGHDSLYKRLTRVKMALAVMAAEYLEPVYKDGAPEGYEEAKEAFRQRMLAKLTNFYGTHAVLAYTAQTDATEAGGALRLALTAEGSQSQGILSYDPGKAVLVRQGKAVLPICVNAPGLVRDDEGAVISCMQDEISIFGGWLEQDVEKLPDMEDYESSVWLSVVNAQDTCFCQRLPQADIPFVLRRCPDSPKLDRQFEGEGSGLIEELVNWEYRMEYEVPFHFPQDQICFHVVFEPRREERMALPPDSLAVKLAQFKYLRGQIWSDIEKYLGNITLETAEQEGRNARIAVESLLKLAEDTAGAGTQVITTSRVCAGGRSFNYTMKEETGTLELDEKQYDSVFFASVQGEQPEEFRMPVLYVNPDEYTPVVDESSSGHIRYWYRDKAGAPLLAAEAQQIRQRQIGIGGLNLFRFQSAISDVTIDRNRQLTEGRETSGAFVYTTGPVGFADVFYASRDIADEIDLSHLPDGKGREADIEEHLARFFRMLTGSEAEGKITLQMEAVYGRKMSNSDEMILLPVFMQPVQTFQGSREESLDSGISLWSRQIREWCRQHLVYDSKKGPFDERNLLQFDLTVFSDRLERQVPLMRFRKLIIPGKWILDQ